MNFIFETSVSYPRGASLLCTLLAALRIFSSTTAWSLTCADDHRTMPSCWLVCTSSLSPLASAMSPPERGALPPKRPPCKATCLPAPVAALPRAEHWGSEEQLPGPLALPTPLQLLSWELLAPSRSLPSQGVSLAHGPLPPYAKIHHSTGDAPAHKPGASASIC